DLLEARDLEPLPLLDRGDEVGRGEQRVVRAGVEPCEAAAQPLDVQRAALQVPAVHVRDLELAALGGLKRGRDVRYALVVEVEAGDGVVGAGPRGLLLDPDRAAAVVEFDDAVPLR